MNRNIDNGKGFLKDKMGGYHAEPPQEVWAAISDRLNGRRRGRTVIILLSAAASIALAVTLGITYFGKDIPQETKLAEERIVQSLSEGNKLETRDNRVEAFNSGTGRQPMEGEKTDSYSQIVSQNLPDAGITTQDDSREDSPKDFEVSPEDSPGDFEVSPEQKGGNNDENNDENPKPLVIAQDAGDAAGEEILLDFNESVDNNPRWALGAVLSPLYSFRDAQPDALAGTTGQESGTLSYAAGVQVGYRATRRLAIESGVLFNKMGISIGAPGIQVFSGEDDFELAGPESFGSRVMAVTNTVGNIVSNTGEIYVNNYLLNASREYSNVADVLSPGVNADQGIRQHLDYLEVPFNLRYTLLDGNFKIQLLGGMSTNLLVNNYVTMETDGVTREIGYLANVRNVNYSGNAGVGFVYHFLDQLSLNVEPRFRYYLNSVNDATLPSTHPYTFGIYTGINYFF